MYSIYVTNGIWGTALAFWFLPESNYATNGIWVTAVDFWFIFEVNKIYLDLFLKELHKNYVTN